jgi:hypothetical protein
MVDEDTVDQEMVVSMETGGQISDKAEIVSLAKKEIDKEVEITIITLMATIGKACTRIDKMLVVLNMTT